MDRTVILSRLETATRHLDKGEQYIGRLREIIADLGLSGSYRTRAEELLRQVAASQEMYVSHRDWILGELKNSTGLM